MTPQVIKRDGLKEQFDVSKIKNSIKKAGIPTGLSDERVEEIATEISNIVVNTVGERDTIASKEIEDILLSELDKIAPAVATSWREYKK